MTTQDSADPAPTPATAGPAEGSAPPGSANKRPLTFGQRIILGLFMVGFALVSLVVVWAQVRARHPHY